MRALREVTPTGSATTRAELAGKRKGAAAALGNRIGSLRRERKLLKLTQRAMQAEAEARETAGTGARGK